MDSEDELTQFNQLLSECSKLLIESGCSSNRLESLLAKLGGIWNFEVESLALPTGVSIMVKKNGKQSVSLSRVRNWQINLDKIQQINDAVDLFFSEKPEISEALKTLKAIEESPAPTLLG
ncbi:MAG: threonine/serine exporter family protein [Bdellovibrionota bacterium]